MMLETKEEDKWIRKNGLRDLRMIFTQVFIIPDEHLNLYKYSHLK